MGDAVISVVVERLAAILKDRISYEVNLVRGVDEEVRDVSSKLAMIRDKLDDAEKRGPKEKSVRKWLKKLEDTAYEMDDILDEWNYTLLKHNMKQKVCCSFIPSSSLSFNKVSDRRKTAKKIQNVKTSLDRILKEGDDFKLVVSDQPTTEPPRPQSTSFIGFDKVCGVDISRNKNDIVSQLMGNNGDTQIVCVVGMGGLGKTTLAQLVFNDTQVKGCFDLTIWICVSDPFDVAGIARGIVDKVGTESIPQNTNQLNLVLEKVRDSISGKKFLLVLDDVWTEDYNKWEPLKMSLDNGAQGSKILVTTRKDGVANMMKRGNVDVEIYRPEELSDEDCWTLLRSISLSGRRDEECGEFEDVGKNIAIKCKGLPLAAKVLGSLLLNKQSLEEWENILKSEMWQSEQAEVELFPHLLLSYNELSPALKRCFSYCAVYPKDFQINAQNLIKEWMALGYLGSVTGNGGVELKGREYFNNLAMRSLFQDLERSSELGEIERCKMHDIVHDFAQFLRKNDDRVVAAEMVKRSCQACAPILVSQVQEYRSLFWDKNTPPHLCDCCLTSLRVLRFKWERNGIPKGMEKSIHLRWLELSGTTLSGEDLKVICSLYFLQTLLLADCSIKEIPGEIGNLVELRHLDLSWNKELKVLPESMCSLVELQTLLLVSCPLKDVPQEIGNLIELRHLDLSWNKELKVSPESMCNLLELQILNIEECSNLSRLPEGIHRLERLQQLLTKFTPVSRHFPQGVAELSGLRALTEFGGGSGCNKLGWLKNLNRLTGSLTLPIHINSIGDLEELVEDAREAELRNKIHLQTLELLFRAEMDETERSSSLWMDVIEALEPNQKLKSLGIWRYKGSRLPDWMSSPLNFIKEIDLNDLSELSSLPPMGKLPFLEVLGISRLDKVKSVGREFLGIEESLSSSSTSSNDDGVVAFPKLKRLDFWNCPKWSEWSDITAEEEESADVSIMPCLTELRINFCWQLKKLPHRLLRKSLQFLDIRWSSELVKSYQDKDGSPWRSISQYNPQLQLRQGY